MNILLVSFFKSSNLGDIMISDILLKEVSKYFKDIKSVDYSTAQIISGSDSIGTNKDKIHAIDKKGSYIRIVKHFKKIKVIRFSLESIRKVMKLKRINRMISKASALVIGGGNMVMDLNYSSTSVNDFSYYIQAAKKLNKPIFVISIGVGPFLLDRNIQSMRELILAADYVTFRDNKSLECLGWNKSSKPNNIQVSVDPVLLLGKYKSIEKKRTIAISIIDLNLTGIDEGRYEKYVLEFTSLINQICDNIPYNISLFSTEVNDYKTVRDIYEGIYDKNRVEVMIINSLNDLMLLYSRSLLVIGTRMHSLIIAATQEIPLIGLAWQQKVFGFFEMINDTKSVFNINELEARMNEIIHLSNYKITNIDKEKEILIQNLNLAKQGFTVNEANLLQLQNIINKEDPNKKAEDKNEKFLN